MDFNALMALHGDKLSLLPFPELNRSLRDTFTTIPEAEHLWIISHVTQTVITVWSEAFINASRINAIAVVKESLGGAVESALDEKERADIAQGYVSFRTHEWLRACFTEYRNITNGRWALTADEKAFYKTLPIHLG
jgi:hypothetical protein